MSNIIRISGQGVAKSPYDFATFSATVRGFGTSGPEAKEKTREVSTRLFDALSTLREKGIAFRDGELRTSFDVQRNNSYNRETHENEFKGYRATFTVTVISDDIEQVGNIHDALTSVEGAEVDSPSLSLTPERREKLEQDAFGAAVEVVRSKFDAQCKAMGLEVDQFQMVNWGDNNGRGHHFEEAGGGKFAALAKCADDAAGGALEFHAGMATVTSDIVISYVRKQQ